MECNTQNQNDQEAFRRIAVMLMALAVLADRAAGCSRSVRALMLWFLRFGETAARDFAAEVCPFAAILPPPQVEDSPQDAARLAEIFRALAVLFFALAEEALCFTGWQIAPRPAPDLLPFVCSGVCAASIAAHPPRAPP